MSVTEQLNQISVKDFDGEIGELDEKIKELQEERRRIKDLKRVMYPDTIKSNGKSKKS